MKKKTLSILNKVAKGKMTPEIAQEKLFDLFGVGQSEQLSCETCIFNTHSWSEDYPCAICSGFDKHQTT